MRRILCKYMSQTTANHMINWNEEAERWCRVEPVITSYFCVREKWPRDKWKALNKNACSLQVRNAGQTHLWRLEKDEKGFGPAMSRYTQIVHEYNATVGGHGLEIAFNPQVFMLISHHVKSQRTQSSDSKTAQREDTHSRAKRERGFIKHWQIAEPEAAVVRQGMLP